MRDHIRSEQVECKVADEANRIEYAHDLSGNFTFLNKTGELITGYSAQDASQMNIAQLVTRECIGKMREQFGYMVEEGLGSVFEIDILTKDGRVVALEVGMGLVVRDGRPSEIQGSAVPSVLRTTTIRGEQYPREYFIF